MEVMVELIQSGADINAATQAGSTPMHDAASMNIRDEVFKELKQWGAKVSCSVMMANF